MKRSLPFFCFFLFLSCFASAQKPGDLHYLDSLKHEITPAIHDSTKVKIWIEIGEYSYDFATDTSMLYWAKCETRCIQNLVRKLSAKEVYFFKSYLARTYNNIAYFFQRNSLKTRNAFAYYTKALSIEQEIGNAKEEGKTLNNLATLYSNIGDMEKAIHYHHLAIRAREKAGYWQGMVISLNNLTAVYIDQGETQKALEYSKRAEDVALKNNLKEQLQDIYSNRGGILLKQEKLIQAEAFYRKSWTIASQLGKENGICRALIEMSGLYVAQNKNDSAIIALNDALALAARQKVNYSIIKIYNRLGAIYQNLNNIPEAEKNLNAALELAQKINRKADLSSAAELLSKIYEQRGNATKALEMYRLHISVRDSLYNETTRKNTIRDQLQYDFDKKSESDSLKMYADKEITNAQFQREKTQRYALYGGLFVLLLFAGFMFNRFKASQKQKMVIEEKSNETEVQKKIIEGKQKEILDSFNYAQRIQHSLLANDTLLDHYFREHFVLFKAKDIVSGDFYWATQANDYFYLAVCDSTGHGVPGAFMSLLNIGFLSEAIKERNIIEPNEVFNYVRSRLEETISKDGNSDGFDGVLMAINQKTKKITYAAANNNPVIITNGVAENLPCDKMPVGKGENYSTFQLYTIDYDKAHLIYLYTDGYPDQFGGEKGKKFKYKNLENLITGNYQRPMKEQHKLLVDAFENWKGDRDQIDDVCVVGIRLHP